MLKKFKKKLNSQVDMQRKKKNEKELIRLFNDFSKQIFEEIDLLNESPQLLNALAIADAFREMCDEIGTKLSKEPFFTGMIKFTTAVRGKDREMDTRITWLKRVYEFDNPDKFRIESRRSAGHVKNFIRTLESYQEGIRLDEEDRILSQKQRTEEKEKQKLEKQQLQEDRREQRRAQRAQDAESMSDEDAPIYLKAKFWIHGKAHPEEIPENIEIIKDFRQNMTPEQRSVIQQPLSQKDEQNNLTRIQEEIMKGLVAFEEQGYYEHVVAIGGAFVDMLENLGQKFREGIYQSREYADLRSSVRTHFLELEEWLRRVERKYENINNRNSNEPKVEKKEISSALEEYPRLRDALIRILEDKRILKYIQDEEKLKNQEIRAEEKQKQAEEKKRLAIEKQKEIEKKKQATIEMQKQAAEIQKRAADLQSGQTVTDSETEEKQKQEEQEKAALDKKLKKSASGLSPVKNQPSSMPSFSEAPSESETAENESAELDEKLKKSASGLSPVKNQPSSMPSFSDKPKKSAAADKDVKEETEAAEEKAEAGDEDLEDSDEENEIEEKAEAGDEDLEDSDEAAEVESAEEEVEEEAE